MDNIKQQQAALDCRWKINNDTQRQEIIRRRLDGEPQSAIARDFNVHQSTISRIMADYFRSMEVDHDGE